MSIFKRDSKHSEKQPHVGDASNPRDGKHSDEEPHVGDASNPPETPAKQVARCRTCGSDVACPCNPGKP